MSYKDKYPLYHEWQKETNVYIMIGSEGFNVMKCLLVKGFNEHITLGALYCAFGNT